MKNITNRCRANFNPQNIPANLKAIKGWVVWMAKEKPNPQPGKFDKMPYYPSGHARKGKQGSVQDKAQLGTFEDAFNAFKENSLYAGLGLAMLPDWSLVAFDGDGCLNDAGDIDADVDALTSGTYTEVSPSGKGIRAFFMGTYKTIRKGNREIYSTTQFVTVTGDALDDTRTLLSVDDVKPLLHEMFAPSILVKPIPPPAYVNGNGQLLDDLRDALEFINPDPYDEWVSIMMALKTAPVGGALDLVHWWSSKSAKYDYAECQAKWDSLAPTLTSFKAIFWKAQGLGWVNPQRSTSGPADGTGQFGRGDSETGEIIPIGPHPLARFVELDKEPKPPRWVLPGVIGQGLTVISGAQGVGKTTTILPLALVVAGLHGGELMPRHWRHVIYVTEDIEQVQRILAGMVRFGGLGIKQEDVKERLHLVAAVRLDAAKVAEVGDFYREQFVRVVKGVEISPLVVFDTKSAIFAVENENDNAEASRLVAAIKQNFANLPVWLVGHISKQNIGRTNVNEISTRGANAIEADANQTIFLVREGDARFIVLSKTRFEPRWRELEVHSYKASLMAKNEFGEDEELLLRWGIAAPASQSRKEATQQALEQQRKEDQAQLRHDIFHTVGAAWVMGNPLNREGVKAKVNRNRQTVTNMIENLLSERWLHEITVPRELRVMNSKQNYLVCLTTEEHEAILAGADLPAAYQVTPVSWQKKVISPVPKSEGENGQGEKSEMSFHSFPFHPFPKKNTLRTGGLNSIFVHPPPLSTRSGSDGNE